jgi:oxygen-dependent protoporphyrinogen oxidase
MRKKSPSTPGTRSAFLTLTTGLAEIVEALVARLENIDLHLKTAATRIIQNGSKFHVEIENSSPLEADYVILATPAYISASLLSSLDESLSADLKSVPYVSTATISLAYQQQVLPRPLDGYGYVIPRREERRVLACTWTSTKFPHRAPHGYALLRVFVGRAGQEFSWSESDLIALAREELALTLGIRVEPILTRVFMWDKAMPQYNLGHPDLLRRIDTALGRHPGLALAGNGYRGIGIPDCIHSGELAVQNIFQNTREMSGTPATPTSL